MTRVLAIIWFAALLVACTGGKSNVEPPSPLANFSPMATVKRVWSVDVGQSEKKKIVTFSPVLHGTVLYVADPAGRVGAYAVDTGRQLWSVRTDEPVDGGVGFGEGLVLLGTKKAHVIALDPEKGSIVWRSEVSSEVLAPPVARSGVVVTQTIDGKMFGISAEDGSTLWMQQRTQPSLSLRGTSAPVVNNGVVLSGFASGKIVAFDLKNGRSLWERTVANPRGRSEIERLIDVDAKPIVVNNVLFAASYQGKIVAISMDNGRVLWSRDVSTYTGMDADQHNVYLTDAEGNVLAFDQRSGTGLWKQNRLRARILNAPTLVANYVAVGDFEGYVHWLSKENGQFVARLRVSGGAIRGKAAAAGDTLYVQNQGGVLAALRIEARTKRKR